MRKPNHRGFQPAEKTSLGTLVRRFYLGLLTSAVVIGGISIILVLLSTYTAFFRVAVPLAIGLVIVYIVGYITQKEIDG